jgi:hypothetical protein
VLENSAQAGCDHPQLALWLPRDARETRGCDHSRAQQRERGRFRDLGAGRRFLRSHGSQGGDHRRGLLTADLVETRAAGFQGVKACLRSACGPIRAVDQHVWVRGASLSRVGRCLHACPDSLVRLRSAHPVPGHLGHGSLAWKPVCGAFHFISAQRCCDADDQNCNRDPMLGISGEQGPTPSKYLRCWLLYTFILQFK